jgi:phage protein D
MEFRPTLTTANQIKSVTVNGWNRDTKSAISQTANLSDLNINRDLMDLLNTCDPREDQVVSEPVFTDGQAMARARDILANRFREMLTCSATTVGLPDIRAGRNVIITGVGSRLSGTYFIKQSTHSIGESGYTTSFNARREDLGQGGQSQ